MLLLAIGFVAAGCAQTTRDCGTLETYATGMYFNEAALRGGASSVRCLSEAYAARAPARLIVKARQAGLGHIWTHDVLFDGYAFRIHIDGPPVDLRNTTLEFFYVPPLDVTCERLERHPPPSYAALDGEDLVMADCSDRRVHFVPVGFLPRDANP